MMALRLVVIAARSALAMLIARLKVVSAIMESLGISSTIMIAAAKSMMMALALIVVTIVARSVLAMLIARLKVVTATTKRVGISSTITIAVAVTMMMALALAVVIHLVHVLTS